MRALLVALLTLAGAEAAAQNRLFMDDAEAARWQAVGRLNAAGMQFCTAVLIAPNLVLTADHCLTNARTKAPFRMQALKFVAGYRKGGFAALRDVRRAARSGFDEGSDIALLELAEPIAEDQIAPVRVGPPEAAAATIVSYGRNRAHAPSIERDCPVAPADAALMAVGCPAVKGMSGAPVMALTGEGPAIMAVISHSDAAGRVYAASAAPVLARLMRRLSEAP
jgi:V8-like Glu-specific endopeptidase